MTRQVSYNNPRTIDRRAQQAAVDLKQAQQQNEALQQVVVEQDRALLDIAVEAVK